MERRHNSMYAVDAATVQFKSLDITPRSHQAGLSEGAATRTSRKSLRRPEEPEVIVISSDEEDEPDYSFFAPTQTISVQPSKRKLHGNGWRATNNQTSLDQPSVHRNPRLPIQKKELPFPWNAREVIDVDALLHPYEASTSHWASSPEPRNKTLPATRNVSTAFGATPHGQTTRRVYQASSVCVDSPPLEYEHPNLPSLPIKVAKQVTVYETVTSPEPYTPLTHNSGTSTQGPTSPPETNCSLRTVEDALTTPATTLLLPRLSLNNAPKPLRHFLSPINQGAQSVAAHSPRTPKKELELPSDRVLIKHTLSPNSETDPGSTYSSPRISREALPALFLHSSNRSGSSSSALFEQHARKAPALISPRSLAEQPTTSTDVAEDERRTEGSAILLRKPFPDSGSPQHPPSARQATLGARRAGEFIAFKQREFQARRDAELSSFQTRSKPLKFKGNVLEKKRRAPARNTKHGKMLRKMLLQREDNFKRRIEYKKKMQEHPPDTMS